MLRAIGASNRLSGIVIAPTAISRKLAVKPIKNKAKDKIVKKTPEKKTEKKAFMKGGADSALSKDNFFLKAILNEEQRKVEMANVKRSPVSKEEKQTARLYQKEITKKRNKESLSLEITARLRDAALAMLPSDALRLDALRPWTEKDAVFPVSRPIAGWHSERFVLSYYLSIMTIVRFHTC